MKSIGGYAMKIDKSKVSHIVALVSIIMFVFVFYSFHNIANFIKNDFISEIVLLLLYVFFIVFISLYTLKNNLKIEFVAFAVFSSVISNIMVNEFLLFISDLFGVFGQKAEYYLYNALLKLHEPYDAVSSMFGRIFFYIVPFIPIIIWILFCNTEVFLYADKKRDN